jgi:RND family efflux transporter MFP subunit
MNRNEVDRSLPRGEGFTEGAPGSAGRVTGAVRARGLVAKLLVLAVVAAAGVWAYYANVGSSRAGMDMSMRVTAGNTPAPVVVAPVERGPIAGTVTYTGSVAPFNEEDIYPRVTGRIVEMPVYPGDAVRPGQVVARLDDVELGSRVREAAAMASAAEANLAQMEAEVLAARHGVTQMERELAMTTAEVSAARDGVAQMEKELTMVETEAGYQELLIVREERLFQSGAVSRQDVENARAMVAAARAKVQATRAKVKQAEAMVVAAQAKTGAAGAKLDQAKAMEASALRKREAMAAMAAQGRAQLGTAQVVRDYVTITAPSAGYVVKRLVAPGVLVQPGMAILKIAQIDKVRLQANVGEKDLASIKVGSPVTVTTTGAGVLPITARVTSVFPFVDQGPRTAVVEAVVDNTGTGRRLLPGQYVTMQFTTGERADAVSVPRGAVTRLGGKATVWVVKEDRAEPRPVTTGLEGPERVEIAQGLAGDERIIARGHEALYAGAPVRDVSVADTGRGKAGEGQRTRPGMSEAPAGPDASGSTGSEPSAQPKGGPHGGH